MGIWGPLVHTQMLLSSSAFQDCPFPLDQIQSSVLLIFASLQITLK